METTTLRISEVPGKGRGVIAKQALAPGEEIEVCPVVVLNITAKPPAMMAYLFHWNGRFALALGYGSLYNHSATPNADWSMDEERRSITFFAIQPIAAGEEICFDYNGDAETLRREFGIS